MSYNLVIVNEISLGHLENQDHLTVCPSKFYQPKNKKGQENLQTDFQFQ